MLEDNIGAAQKDNLVTFNILPNAGYEVKSVTFTPSSITWDNNNQNSTFTMPDENVTINITFGKTQDLIDLEAAQTAINNLALSFSLEELNNAALESALQEKIGSAIDNTLTALGNGVQRDESKMFNVTIAPEPKDGDATDMDGTQGKFSFFNVPLGKGSLNNTNLTGIVGNANGIITVKRYVIVVKYPITVKTAKNGTVSADITTAEGGKTITLTATPNADYELKSITSTPNLNLTTAASQTFTMPDEEVIITPVFGKTQTVADQDTIDKTKAALEGIGLKSDPVDVQDKFSVPSTQANTEDAVKNWLEALFSQIIKSSRIYFEITTTSFEAAVDGKIGTTPPKNGHYKFKVKFKMGLFTKASDAEPELYGEVTITPKPASVGYTVGIGSFANGSISLNSTTNVFSEGNTVELTVTPATGYKLSWIATNPPIYELTTTHLSFSMPSSDVTINAAFEKKEEKAASDDIADALDSEIPNLPASTTGSGSEEDIKKALADYLNSLSTNAVNTPKVKPEDITLSDVDDPTAGDENNHAGTPGSFDYEVTLPDGSKVSGEGTLLPKTFTDQSAFYISQASMTGGSITIAPVQATYSGMTVITLTPVPATGYAYVANSLKVYKKGDANTNVPFTSTDASTGVSTFSMPAYDVEISATFTAVQSGNQGNGNSNGGDNEVQDPVLPGEGNTTAIENIQQTVEAPALKAIPTAGGLNVVGLSVGKPLYIYNMLGQLVYSAIAASDTQTVYLTHRGVYILVNDNRTVKTVYN
jgi:hypothetical protein